MLTSKVALGLFMLVIADAASGQQSGGAGTTTGAGSGANANGNAAGGSSTSRPNVPSNPGAPPGYERFRMTRPYIVTGNVILADGGSPSMQIRIERVCNENPHVEGYVDLTGTFYIQLGRNTAFQDARTASTSSPLDRLGTGGMQPSPIDGRDLFGCQLRAALEGYRSDIVNLGPGLLTVLDAHMGRR